MGVECPGAARNLLGGGLRGCFGLSAVTSMLVLITLGVKSRTDACVAGCKESCWESKVGLDKESSDSEEESPSFSQLCSTAGEDCNRDCEEEADTKDTRVKYSACLGSCSASCGEKQVGSGETPERRLRMHSPHISDGDGSSSPNTNSSEGNSSKGEEKDCNVETPCEGCNGMQCTGCREDAKVQCCLDHKCHGCRGHACVHCEAESLKTCCEGARPLAQKCKDIKPDSGNCLRDCVEDCRVSSGHEEAEAELRKCLKDNNCATIYSEELAAFDACIERKGCSGGNGGKILPLLWAGIVVAALAAACSLGVFEEVQRCPEYPKDCNLTSAVGRFLWMIGIGLIWFLGFQQVQVWSLLSDTPAHGLYALTFSIAAIPTILLPACVLLGVARCCLSLEASDVNDGNL